MRLINKGPFTGALVFLPFVLVFGCARAPSPVSAGKTDKDVTITLVMQSDGKLMPVPDPKTVQLYKKMGHVAHWVYCGQGDLNISMKPGSDNDPFEPGDWEHGSAKDCKYDRSPKIKANAREKKEGQPYNPYKYTITVTGVPNTVPNDPDIEIME
jgi:hypothetical protein